MRVSVDLDSLDKEKLRWTCRKGKKLCGKRPDRIYMTRHGYHLIWMDVQKQGRPITEKGMFEYRKRLNDDGNRIKLDLCGNRVRQVLFSEKRVKFFNVPDEGERSLTKIESFKRIRVR
jgi:hypothetical protein